MLKVNVFDISWHVIKKIVRKLKKKLVLIKLGKMYRKMNEFPRNFLVKIFAKQSCMSTIKFMMFLGWCFEKLKSVKLKTTILLHKFNIKQNSFSTWFLISELIVINVHEKVHLFDVRFYFLFTWNKFIFWFKCNIITFIFYTDKHIYSPKLNFI